MKKSEITNQELLQAINQNIDQKLSSNKDDILTAVNVYIFFFSSRRRHTRLVSDWSSDVCYSDRSEEHTSELQAEDGIRDWSVTGVQTCALPIDRKSTRLNSSH